MKLDRKCLIEAMFSVMEVKIGMCTEKEARAVLKELQERPYTIDLASSWESYLKASFWDASHVSDIHPESYTWAGISSKNE